ncbi:MAG: DegV family protein [Peptoniphilaceae bacterium]|nr:DegV family protein [Peptoniphilaceae bacterium]
MIRILADSASDFHKEWAEKNHLVIVPLHVLLGDDDRLDGINITPDKLYEWAEKNHKTPTTSGVVLDTVIQEMRKILDEGDDILALSMSSKMSGTYGIMKLAVEELHAGNRVEVIDSLGLTAGIQILAYEAMDRLQAGEQNLQKLAEEIRELVPKIRNSFVIDTLEYLRRGGRCSGMAAMLGSMLRLHPEIVCKDGVLVVGKKYRGAMPNVMKQYIDAILAVKENADPKQIYISTSGGKFTTGERAIDMCETIRERLAEDGYFRDIRIVQAGSVISSHAGPGTIGIMYRQK